MRRKFIHSSGGNVRLRGGRVVAKHLAKIVGRCAECLGALKYHNNGLACATDIAHKGFMHRDDAAPLKAERIEQLEQVEADYTVLNGQLIAKNDPMKEVYNDY